MRPDELNEQFGIRGAVTFDQGRGGLTRMSIAAAGAEAEIYLLGGHVTAFTPAGCEPVLWVSSRSPFAIGQPIRGGVPVCHPWFAERPGAPLHGYVRLMEFSVESVTQEADGSVAVVLHTKYGVGNSNWPGNFELRNRVTVGEVLAMALETRNCGEEDLTITEALHSYFRVSDVRNVSIAGLEGCEYFGKVTGGENRFQGDEPVTFTGETDSVYLNTQAECVLTDPGMGRKIHVAKSGSSSTVLWNPWIDKARRMPDFGDDEWQEMVCIETANALGNAVTIGPGESHTREARIRTEASDDAAQPGARGPRRAAAPVRKPQGPDWARLTARVYVRAHPARLFEAWATGPGLLRWLLKAAAFRAPQEQLPRPDAAARTGDAYRWTWRSAGRVAEGRILAADWPERIEFTLGPAGKCRVSLTPDGELTLVEVVQSDVPDAATYLEWSNAWTFHLTNLKSVLEGGPDLREADPDRTDVVNR